jgi:hypothetical protein
VKLPFLTGSLIMSDNTATILHTLPDGTEQHLRLTRILIDATVVDGEYHD